jgi:hypothetical protein
MTYTARDATSVHPEELEGIFIKNNYPIVVSYAPFRHGDPESSYRTLKPVLLRAEKAISQDRLTAITNLV